ncbi:hypothetical protein FRC14_004462 [Serendipita sp. 396]|nr:hypothetical protein FRC14_004462 [Serendipita sp. 396]KAG8782170.1 hypothetical protein FRC15_007402 [Serendipita sp. 397]KAG8798228.1 hypothetical protein FRC16_007671 [Serendipita sp. 398]KAG8867429.1 hypothetical protein FRC20_005774 [Serendipita sp. 405]
MRSDRLISSSKVGEKVGLGFVRLIDLISATEDRKGGAWFPAMTIPFPSPQSPVVHWFWRRILRIIRVHHSCALNNRRDRREDLGLPLSLLRCAATSLDTSQPS